MGRIAGNVSPSTAEFAPNSGISRNAVLEFTIGSGLESRARCGTEDGEEGSRTPLVVLTANDFSVASVDPRQTRQQACCCRPAAFSGCVDRRRKVGVRGQDLESSPQRLTALRRSCLELIPIDEDHSTDFG